VDIKRNENTGFAMNWTSVNSKGVILQRPSHMEGVSWCADRKCPEEQTSRVRIIAVSSDETAAVTACNGVASEMMSTQRTNAPIFLIAEM
jgi:hypothetical protein